MKKLTHSPVVEQLELFKPIQIFSTHRLNESTFTFVDLFAGIGGFRIPLELLGGKCLGYSEIDREAIKVYQQNFIAYCNQYEKYLGDITKISKLPFDVDIIVGGVPCQSWSVAGKLQGFNDPRGLLWFDTIRVVKENKPKAFIFENVRTLMSDLHRSSLKVLLLEFEKIGYCVKVNLLNSYDFGVPQNRERTFIVGVRNDLDNYDKFNFPQPVKFKPKLINILDKIDELSLIDKPKINPYILFGEKIPYSRNRFQKNDEFNDFFVFCDTRAGHTTIHSWDLIRTTEREKQICYTILRNRRKSKYGDKDGNPLSFQDLSELIPGLKQKELEQLIRKRILRYIPDLGYEFFNSKNSAGINGVYRVFLPSSDAIPTLTATGMKDFLATVPLSFCEDPLTFKQMFIKEIYRKKQYRPISAQDAKRLQGFPDWFKMHENEDTAKFQFGNAVSVPVVYYTAESLLKLLNLINRSQESGVN